MMSLMTSPKNNAIVHGNGLDQNLGGGIWTKVNEYSELQMWVMWKPR